ncbi:unnamed protein product [Sphagnum troendelagicum]|uniref:TMEM205-like domain-containing protein n=1 Tax=Sphagnum troendelagicum TaxID=128251 RepID=A0ABP0UU84_9BRYO
MMNIVALGLLLTSLGSVMILSREPLLVKDPADAGNEANVLLVKEVRRRPGENNNSNDVDDAAPAAVGRRLKRVAEAAYKPVTEAVEALNRKTEEIVDSNKEKVAKAAETVSSNNKKPKSSPEKLSFWTSRKKQDTSADDHLLAAKEKAAAASQAFEEATRLLEDATREKLAALHEVSPEGILQRTEVKHKVLETVDSAQGKVSETAATTTDTATKAVEKTKEAAEGAYKTASATLGAAKDKTSDAIGSTTEAMEDAVALEKDKTYETAQSVKNKTCNAVESTKDCVLNAAGAAKDTILDNTEFVVERSKGTAANAAEKAKEEAQAADNAVLGFAEVVKEVAGKTAECLLHTAQEAGSYLPNVGQGVGYVYDKSADRIGHEEAQSTTENASKLSDSAKEELKARSNQQVLHAPAGSGEEEVSQIYKRTTTEGKQAHEVLLLETKELIGDADANADNAPEHVKDELGVIAQTIGWRRVGIIVKDYNPCHLTPFEIVLGDVKYVWVGKPHPKEEQQTFLHKVLRSIKGAADNVRHFLGFSGGVKKKQHHTGVGEASKKRSVDGAASVKEKQVDNNAKGDATTMNGYVDVIYKGKESLMEGVKAAGQEYEAGRAQASEYADQARSELQGTVGWLQDNTTSEEEKLPHSWKQMFVSRPRGFLLSLIRLLHLFTFSIIYGSALWVTFVSGLILSNNLPQQQFSFMQSRIFPIYLRLLAAGELLLTMLHSLLHPWFSADKLETWQLQNFVWILVATLINLLLLEPWETKLMFEKLRLEKGGWVHDTTPEELRIVLKAEKKKNLEEINEKLKTLHTYLSALNLLTLAGLTWHLSYLARRSIV